MNLESCSGRAGGARSQMRRRPSRLGRGPAGHLASIHARPDRRLTEPIGPVVGSSPFPGRPGHRQGLNVRRGPLERGRTQLRHRRRHGAVQPDLGRKGNKQLRYVDGELAGGGAEVGHRQVNQPGLLVFGHEDVVGPQKPVRQLVFFEGGDTMPKVGQYRA